MKKEKTYFISANGNQEIWSIITHIRQKRLQKKSLPKKEEYYIMIKGSTQEKDITFNIYAPIVGAPTCINQILTDKKGIH